MVALLLYSTWDVERRRASAQAHKQVFPTPSSPPSFACMFACMIDRYHCNRNTGILVIKIFPDVIGLHECDWGTRRIHDTVLETTVNRYDLTVTSPIWYLLQGTIVSTMDGIR